MKKLIIILMILVFSGVALVSAEEELPWKLDFYGGVNIPARLELKDVADTGYVLGYGVGYQIKEHWLARMSLGFHRFTENNNVQVTYVPWQLGINYFIPMSEMMSLYVGTRTGAYFGADDIRSTDFGFAPFVGLAFERESGAQWYVEPRFTFVFNEKVYTEYFGVNVGFRPFIK